MAEGRGTSLVYTLASHTQELRKAEKEGAPSQDYQQTVLRSGSGDGGQVADVLENGVDSHGMTVDKVADTNALGKLSRH